jgi:hypothetical protein
MASTANHRYPRIEGEDHAALAAELEFEGEDEYEDESEYEDEAFLGGIAQALGGLLGEGEGEDESEFEFEFEAEAEAESEEEAAGEGELFVNPLRRVYQDAELMAHLSAQAARTESESESEAFIGALIPLAAQLIPRAAMIVRRNAPTLIRGSMRLARQLRSQPRTRRLINTLPVILQRSAQSLADQAASGRVITSAQVLQTLGGIAERVLTDPADCRNALSAVGTFDRRYHRRSRNQSYSRDARGIRGRRPPAPGSPARRPKSSSAARRGRRRP